MTDQYIAEPVGALSHSCALRVTAPARLHLGLLNETGLFGRVDGGAGFAVGAPRWRYTLHIDHGGGVSGNIDAELAATANQALTSLARHFGLTGLALNVHESVPTHIGLGSKTSLLMSLARAAAQFAQTVPDATVLAGLVRRGGTSGVGVHVSERGGFIVDAGRAFPTEKELFGPSSSSTACAAPKLIMRLGDGGIESSFLRSLRVVHMRFEHSGVSGAAESAVFAQTCPIPTGETAALLATFYAQVLTGLLTGDGKLLQSGFADMQTLGMKRAEWQIQSPTTLRFRQYFHKMCPDLALCLSSMGPTVFCLTTDPDRVLDAAHSFDEVPLHAISTHISMTGTRLDAEA